MEAHVGIPSSRRDARARRASRGDPPRARRPQGRLRARPPRLQAPRRASRRSGTRLGPHAKARSKPKSQSKSKPRRKSRRRCTTTRPFARPRTPPRPKPSRPRTRRSPRRGPRGRRGTRRPSAKGKRRRRRRRRGRRRRDSGGTRGGGARAVSGETRRRRARRRRRRASRVVDSNAHVSIVTKTARPRVHRLRTRDVLVFVLALFVLVSRHNGNSAASASRFLASTASMRSILPQHPSDIRRYPHTLSALGLSPSART